LDLQEDKDMIYAVGGAINTDSYTDLLEYKNINGLDYRLSIQSELGKFVDFFYRDFLFIGKSNKIIGSLSYLADVSDIDAMIKRTSASFFDVYLVDHPKYLILEDGINEFYMNSFFVNGGTHHIEYSVIESSDPSVCDYEIIDRKLILSKGQSQGNSNLTLQAKISGRDQWIRTRLSVINNTTASDVDNFEYSILEDSPVNWISGGDNKWRIDEDTAFSGYKSLKSGTIGDGQSSELSLNLFLDFPGIVSFAYKTDTFCSFSTELSDGDFLNFIVNDVNMSLSENREFWGGLNDWRMVSYQLKEGSHSIKWQFLKNGWGISEEDAVWIDFVLLPGEILKDSHPVDRSKNYTIEVYPNPFNPDTKINFSLKKEQFVKISLYDSKGRFVKKIIEGSLGSGQHSFCISADNLSTGIYFTVFEADKTMISNKIMFIK
jgi:hypothetical protein